MRNRNDKNKKTDWLSLFMIAFCLFTACAFFAAGSPVTGILWVLASAFFFAGFARSRLKK